MSQQTRSGLLEKTLKNLRKAWQGIAGAAYDESAASMQPDLPDDDAERLRQQMHACLEAQGGEVSARARAAALGRAYMALNETGRERFLLVLAEDFDVDRERIDTSIETLQASLDLDTRCLAESRLRKELRAPRIELLRQFNALPEGVKFLVDMRADLLDAVRRHPPLRGLEQDLKELLRTWFDVDFLELRRIAWDTASASLLEKLIAYEAVHRIESWDDLKNRLDSDRRCFAYFHPRMPDEPLIFVEVALVDGMADNVQALLDENAPVIDPETADTAIFYSISNAQRGLAGISFGNFLIKRVADTLSGEFKGLKDFATLSPVPGFCRWLESRLAEGDKDLLTSSDRKILSSLETETSGSKGKLKSLMEGRAWVDNNEIDDLVKPLLMRLCAQYLVHEKSDDKGLRVLDPVAHFHLSNGARMERLNWRGDLSEKGLRQSAGMMINYRYKLSAVEENHENYTSKGKVVTSSSMRSLM